MTDTPECATPEEPETVEYAILSELARRPNRTWNAETITDRVGVPMVTGLTSLARLSRAGRIDRVAPGQYRHATEPAESVESIETMDIANQ